MKEITSKLRFTYSLSLKKVWSILVFLICFQSLTSAQNIVSWNDLAADHGGINSNDIIVVGSNDRLVLTHSCNTNLNRNVRGVIVYGEFVIEDAGGATCGELSLTTDFIFVAQNGLFQVGSQADPFDNDFLITLTGDQGEDINLAAVIGETAQYIPSSNNLGSTSPSASMIENMVGTDNLSFIMAMGNNARIEIHSTDASKKTWVQLRQTANSGSTVLRVAEPTGWEVGDRIVMASTDFDLNQAEDFTITAVANDSRNITIDRPTEFMHYGVIETYSNATRSWDLDMRGEVGLLSRKVKIRGDVAYDNSRRLNQQPDKYGGHIMAMEEGEMRISGVEFEHMGQGTILGRYATHWHMLGDVTGQFITNSSYHHTFNKGMTIHGTKNALIQENLVYESIGHSYFIEDGSETGNRFIANVAINTRKPRTSGEAPSDSSDFSDPSNFWIENADNIFEGNHAAGSEGHGFWFDLKGLNGLSRDRSARERFGFVENREGPNHFIGNVAHSTQDKGFAVQHGNIINGEGYQGTDANPQAVDENWHVEDYTGYKNLVSLYCRGMGGVYSNIKIGESETGTRFRVNQHLENSLIVGRTGNIGNPRSAAEIARGRSIALGDSQGIFEGHQLYDGPAGAVDVHFEGFTEPGDYAINESNAVMKSVYHYVSGVTFGAGILERNKLHFGNSNLETRGIVDLDGSLTGMVGATIIGNARNNVNILTQTPEGEYNNAWNAIVHPPSRIFGSMKVVSANRAEDSNALVSQNFYTNAPSGSAVNGTKVIAGDGTITTRVAYERNGETAVSNLRASSGQSDQALFLANEHNNTNYKIRIENAPTRFNFYVNDLPMGHSVIYEIEGINVRRSALKFGYASTETVPRVASLADLENANTTVFYRNFETGNIHVKFVSQFRHGFLLPQPRMIHDNRELGGVMVHVTLENTLSADSDAIDLEDLSVYPNPVTNKFQVELAKTNSEVNNIQVVSLLGVVVKEFNYNLNGSYDISELNKGLYFVILRNNETVVHSKKIIKN